MEKEEINQFSKKNSITIYPPSVKKNYNLQVYKKHKNKNLYESLSAYEIGFHRHNSEIEQEISKVCKKKFQFSFTPHLTPMFKGILSTIYINVPKKMNAKRIYNSLKKVYKNMMHCSF